MKKTILLVVGRSGSGKSELANYLQERWGIPYLQSYTTRPRRNEQDNGHKFITDEEFDELLVTNTPLALTNWNGVRYCCTVEDLSGIDTYVIDERGVDYLESRFKGDFNLFKVFVNRDLEKRIGAVGEERVLRDSGNFYKTMKDYDMVIDNNSNMTRLYNQADIVVNRLHKLFGISLDL
jgi:guanylate kinase